jgi:hypothetical protein
MADATGLRSGPLEAGGLVRIPGAAPGWQGARRERIGNT